MTISILNIKFPMWFLTIASVISILLSLLKDFGIKLFSEELLVGICLFSGWLVVTFLLLLVIDNVTIQIGFLVWLAGIILACRTLAKRKKYIIPNLLKIFVGIFGMGQSFFYAFDPTNSFYQVSGSPLMKFGIILGLLYFSLQLALNGLQKIIRKNILRKTNAIIKIIFVISLAIVTVSSAITDYSNLEHISNSTSVSKEFLASYNFKYSLYNVAIPLMKLILFISFSWLLVGSGISKLYQLRYWYKIDGIVRLFFGTILVLGTLVTGIWDIINQIESLSFGIAIPIAFNVIMLIYALIVIFYSCFLISKGLSKLKQNSNTVTVSET